MRVEHLAIDGAIVAIDANADLGTRATATGWAMVPSLLQQHPFAIYPPGHSRVVEENIRAVAPDLRIEKVESFDLKQGTVRVAEVNLPTATRQMRSLTVGAWEGKSGCLTTSLVGHQMERLVEVFDTLQFSESDNGLAIDSPVVANPRVPEVFKEIPEVGVLAIRPAVSSELQRIPKMRGCRTKHGEVFRANRQSRGIILVGDSVVVYITPLPEIDIDRMLSVSNDLRLEWLPRKADTC